MSDVAANPLPGSPAPRLPANGELAALSASRTQSALRSRFAGCVACGMGVFFVWVAIQKVFSPDATLVVLERLTSWPSHMASITAYLLASVEWVLGLWLLSGVRQRGALIVSMVLLAAFTGALVMLRLDGFNGDCGCGVGAFSVAGALLRNGLLLALLAVALVANPVRQGCPRMGE